MSKIVGMNFVALLILLSTISNVRGVVNFQLPKSYIQEALEAFREIVNNAELTNQIHEDFNQQTQITTVYEPIAAAADTAYAQYDQLLRDPTVIQNKWRKIRNTHIRYTMQMFEFCQNEQMNTQEYLRIPMDAFGELFAETAIIMGGLNEEAVAKRTRQEEQVTRRVMAELAYRRNQRGEDMGLPNPNDPYHGFNPIEDYSDQGGAMNTQNMGGNVDYDANQEYGGGNTTTSYGGPGTFDGSSSSSTYYGGPGSEGNLSSSTMYYGNPATSNDPNATVGFDGGNLSTGNYVDPALDPNNPNSPYYGNFGFDPNTDPRFRRQGGN